MPNIYPSTYALSVFNAVRMRNGRATESEVLMILREHWNSELQPESVAAGVEFLRERGMIVVDGEKLSNPRTGSRLVRIDEDRDLDWA